MKTPRKTPGGFALLNLGCGKRYSPEWNNLDFFANDHVEYHDIRDPLPYASGIFNGVYASHVLEHMTLETAGKVVREAWRVLRPGGVCRLAVPDLERLSRGYLMALQAVAAEPTAANRMKYDWAVAALLDQMVREKGGGRMGELLQRGHFDRDYLRENFGDEFGSCWAVGGEGKAPARIRRTLADSFRRRWEELRSKVCPCRRHPHFTGESHKWMWDGHSLGKLLEEVGFVEVATALSSHSRFPDWDRYRLDESVYLPGAAAKPDSVYVEGTKAH